MPVDGIESGERRFGEPGAARYGPSGGAPRRTSIWRSVRRDAIFLGLGSIGVVISQFGFRSLALTSLDPAAYGRLTLIVSFYSTAMIVGASGLPDSASRYLAMLPIAADRAVVAAARKAVIVPAVLATVAAVLATALILRSPTAMLLSLVGMPALVYSQLSAGVLRGREHVKWAAAILPAGALSQLILLGCLRLAGLSLTPELAFSCFCAGNCVGWLVGVAGSFRTAPDQATASIRNGQLAESDSIPSAWELLTFSAWLALATIGVAVLPLIMRSLAVTDSFAIVAMIDVALVLLALPQRIGVVLVMAVIPHASRAVQSREETLAISVREYALLIVPFVAGAAMIEFTPWVSSLFTLIGKPEYRQGVEYIALALLAGPARILYGLVQGMLIAHGEGRFLALSAWAVTCVSALFMALAMLDHLTLLAFGVFVLACWAIYWLGTWRLHRLPTAAATVPA